MPPKKETFLKIDENEAFEPYLDENYPKLVIVDLYFPWSGPCDAMKEHYKTIHNNTNGFAERCDIIQLKHGKIKFFENHGIMIRAKFTTAIHFYLQRENLS